MTTPGTFDDALWCAWSWLRFLAREVRLAIYIDGPVGTRERQAVETLFPGGTITNARTVISETEDLSSAAEGYFTHHPYGRKLGVLLELQKKEPVFYCDSDVLAFSQPDEIIASIKDGKVGAHIQEEEGTRAYDRLILATAPKARNDSVALLEFRVARHSEAKSFPGPRRGSARWLARLSHVVEVNRRSWPVS